MWPLRQLLHQGLRPGDVALEVWVGEIEVPAIEDIVVELPVVEYMVVRTQERKRAAGNYLSRMHKL